MMSAVQLIPLLILISAALHIRSDFKQQLKQTYFFKPLTIIITIVFCFLQTPEVSTFYRNMIILGLIFSMIGDIYLMLPKDKFLHGLGGFFVAHIFYLGAFISDSKFPVNYFLLIPGLIIIAVVLRILLPKVGRKKVPVILYAIILVLLLWQSLGRVELAYSHSGIVALVGIVFFISSDTILVLSRFVKQIKHRQLYILSTYYLAQLLIATSV